eukprot:COSAG01_NODE_1803_length_9197_cov_11.062321_2_plen_88_part_00
MLVQIAMSLGSVVPTLLAAITALRPAAGSSALLRDGHQHGHGGEGCAVLRALSEAHSASLERCLVTTLNLTAQWSATCSHQLRACLS